MAARQAWKAISQKNDAVAGRCLGLDRGRSPNDECGDYETDKTCYYSPPMAKHNARAHADQEYEQNRQPPG
jgi:hypothetical protein